MLRRLARFSLRHRRLVAAAWAVLFVAGIAIGSGVFDRLDPDVGDVEGTESARADARLRALDPGGPSIAAVADDVDPRDPRVAAGIRATARRLRAIPGVAQVADPYEGPPELLARDGRAALVAVELAPGLDDDRFDRALDRAEAELLSMPVVLVLLLVVFGGIVAAGLPVLVALVGISAVTDVSVYSVNVAASLAGLPVFADPFLRSMAYGGGAVVLIVVVLAEAGTDPAGLARVTAFGDRSPGWTGSWPSASSGRWPKASRSWRSCPTAVGPTP